jgi:S1-C subfamily serine protease
MPFATNTPLPMVTSTPFSFGTNTPAPLATNTPSTSGAQVTQQPLLGFDAVVVNSDAVATSLSLPAGTRGIYVSNIQPGSVAANSNLQNGDVITGVNGVTGYTPEELLLLLQYTLMGQQVNLDVLRNGAQIQLPLKTGL